MEVINVESPNYSGFQVLNREEQRTAHRTTQKLEKRERKSSGCREKKERMANVPCASAT
uniref:Uncharacterized protein n=1 Tax=Oryza sativa subsp. japonica TaxID=39947 RepID=Q7EYV1_ORYSJ|nr:hypothetical protein [Oryza sativa Japonica Group]